MGRSDEHADPSPLASVVIGYASPALAWTLNPGATPDTSKRQLTGRERAAPTLTREKTIFVASDPHHLPPYPDMVGSAVLKHPRRSRPDLPLARATLNPRASPPHLHIRRRQLHRPYLRSPRVLTATFNSLEVRRQWNSATRKRVGGGTRRWRGDRAIRDGRLACVGYQQPLHLEREV